MGLGIAAYSHLKRIGFHIKDVGLNDGEPGGLEDWCHYDHHVFAYAYDSFPESFRGIPIIGCEASGRSALIKGGCYEITDQTEVHSFHAGSYGSYNAWREDLATQFNLCVNRDGPFYELIWFADNGGTIGPDAARDLLTDFRQYATAYSPPASHPDFWQEKYRDWMRACELAADGGLIDFH